MMDVLSFFTSTSPTTPHQKRKPAPPSALHVFMSSYPPTLPAPHTPTTITGSLCLAYHSTRTSRAHQGLDIRATLRTRPTTKIIFFCCLPHTYCAITLAHDRLPPLHFIFEPTHRQAMDAGEVELLAAVLVSHHPPSFEPACLTDIRLDDVDPPAAASSPGLPTEQQHDKNANKQQQEAEAGDTPLNPSSSTSTSKSVPSQLVITALACVAFLLLGGLGGGHRSLRPGPCPRTRPKGD